MSIRIGRFYPHAGYAQMEPLYQELTTINADENLEIQTSRSQQKVLEFQERREELRQKIAQFSLQVLSDAGELIETSWIHIDDAAHELGEEERQITICVKDSAVFHHFFGDS